MTKLKAPDMYAGKNILAPMVRIGTLPTRLLALKYGADLVYSEELIDHRLVNCRRVENVDCGTIDFLEDEDSRPMFQTCTEERDSVIVQIGTNDPERALKVARLMEKDIAGIDINMGCPKEYSTKGGMGAALLEHPEKIRAILTTLVSNLTIPVTCKIRILPSLEDTISLVRMIESTGVSALAVHGRTRIERPHHSVHADFIKAVVNAIKIPVIANGGSGEIIKEYSDIEKFRVMTNASSVMLARAAQWNLSIFRTNGSLDKNEIISDYLKLAMKYDNHFVNCKYVVQELLRNLETDDGRALRDAQSLREICAIWDLVDLYDTTNAERKEERLRRAINAAQIEPMNSETIVSLPIKFDNSLYKMKRTSPKSILLEYTREKKYKSPHFKTVDL